MKTKNLTSSLFIILLATLVIGCSKIQSLSDRITNPSAREVYQREFDDNQALFEQWQLAYRESLSDSIEVGLPYGEKGNFNPETFPVHSYNIDLREGKIFTAEIIRDSLHHRVFVDLFQLKDSSFVHLESLKINENVLFYEPKNSGTYKLVIQPEIEANTDFFIALNDKPSYFFPVAGKSNRDIQSFWGAQRDGGRRSHEGVDIFAKRGTPVVAAADGRVSRTGNYGLGGKQVWLRAGNFGGNSLYYAHLDSIAVTSGTRVETGDTLGFVGNTGNAKTTAPHLHFGIYKGYSGAVDPLPFIFTTAEINEADFARNFNSDSLVVKNNVANLRIKPTTSADLIGKLQKTDTLLLLGQNKDWLHVKTAANQKAFIHKSLVQEL